MNPDALRWGTPENYVAEVSFHRVFVEEGALLRLASNETVKKVDYVKERLVFGVIVMRTHVSARSGS